MISSCPTIGGRIRVHAAFPHTSTRSGALAWILKPGGHMIKQAMAPGIYGEDQMK
eukprot:SAG11_NODE_30055_length_304_cov_2.009756_1_plen_54_part_10